MIADDEDAAIILRAAIADEDAAIAEYSARLIVLSMQAQSDLKAKIHAILDESLRFQTQPDLSAVAANLARAAAARIVSRISVNVAVDEWWNEHPELTQ